MCVFCRNELPLAECDFEEENPADRLFCGQRAVIKAGALLQFESGGTTQKLIHYLKYRGQQQVGEWLGAWYGGLLKTEKSLDSIDWVLPVPLHPRKKRQRGYNQCDRFARRIAESLGAMYSDRLLVRRRSGQTQTARDRWRRFERIRGVFRVADPGALAGARVLLVDDVITTGATLDACCEALGSIAGIRIFIAAMALVPSRQFPN